MTPGLTPRAGEVGVPVDAVCIGCSADDIEREATKRVTLDELGVDDLEEVETASFRHVCHRCQTATFWNVREVRHDLLERGEVA